MTRESGIKRTGVVCLYIATIALALFLLVQHWFHVPQYLPYLLFLACPLMHLFMHRGHGSGLASRATTERHARPKKRQPPIPGL
jgi:hypothetical protein